MPLTHIGQVTQDGPWHLGDAERTLCGLEWQGRARVRRPGKDPTVPAVLKEFDAYRNVCEAWHGDRHAQPEVQQWLQAQDQAESNG